MKQAHRQTERVTVRRLAISVAALLMVVSCSGGGSDSPGPLPPIASTVFSGTWVGTYSTT